MAVGSGDASAGSIFTELVRALEPGGTVPDDDVLDGVWRALRAALRSELKRRGLWSSPPSFLGVYGFASWSETGWPDERPTTLGRGEALDELTANCFEFIFIERLRSLKAQLERKPQIDGLVALHLRNFLYDTQKAHDPLGFRVFEVVWSVTCRLIEERVLYVLAGDERVRNDTVLAFAPERPPATARLDLRRLVSEWIDDLLPDLVTARGPARAAMEHRLHDHLAELGEHGLQVFRFKDLVDALKVDVRARWSALLEQEHALVDDEGGNRPLAATARLLHSETTSEDSESFRQLLACVGQSLAGWPGRRKTRRHLQTLFEFLRVYAASADTGGTDAESTEGLPSQRQLASLLHIPRDRIPELLSILGELIRDCQARRREGVAVLSSQAVSGSSPYEGRNA